MAVGAPPVRRVSRVDSSSTPAALRLHQLAWSCVTLVVCPVVASPGCVASHDKGRQGGRSRITCLVLRHASHVPQDQRGPSAAQALPYNLPPAGGRSRTQALVGGCTATLVLQLSPTGQETGAAALCKCVQRTLSGPCRRPPCKLAGAMSAYARRGHRGGREASWYRLHVPPATTTSWRLRWHQGTRRALSPGSIVAVTGHLPVPTVGPRRRLR